MKIILDLEMMNQINLTIPIFVISIILLTIAYFLFKVQRAKMLIQDAVTWMIFNILLLSVGILLFIVELTNSSGSLDKWAGNFGFASFDSVILLVIVAWIWLRLFKITTRYSGMSDKISQLSQELGKIRYELDNGTKEILKKPTRKNNVKKTVKKKITNKTSAKKEN